MPPCPGPTVQERYTNILLCCLYVMYKRYVYFKLVYVTYNPGGDNCSQYMYQGLISELADDVGTSGEGECCCFMQTSLHHGEEKSA